MTSNTTLCLSCKYVATARGWLWEAYGPTHIVSAHDGKLHPLNPSMLQHPDSSLTAVEMSLYLPGLFVYQD